MNTISNAFFFTVGSISLTTLMIICGLLANRYPFRVAEGPKGWLIRLILVCAVIFVLYFAMEYGSARTERVHRAGRERISVV